MNLLQKIIQFHSFEDERSISKDVQNKLFILSAYCSIGAFFTFLYSVFFLLQGKYNWVILSLSGLLFLLSSLFYIKKKLDFKTTSTVLVSLSFVALLISFTLGGAVSTESLWFYIFPPFALFVLGLEVGTIFSIALLLVAIVVSFVNGVPVLSEMKYTASFKFTFFTSYLAVFLLSFVYELMRKTTRQKLIESMLEAKRSNQTNKAKAEFMAELSHQIRTPLSSIMGVNNVLKNTTLTEYQQELIDAINSSANNLVSVVNKIVNVSELTVDSENDNVLSFNMLELIRSTVNDFKSRNPKSDLRDTINVSRYIPQKLTGNPLKLRSILNEIMLNIAKGSKRHTIHFDIFVSEKKENSNSMELMFEIHTTSLKYKKGEFITDDLEYNYSADQDSVQLNMNQSKINEKENFVLYNLQQAKKIVESFGGRLGVRFIEPNIYVFWFTIMLWKSNAKDFVPDDQVESSSTSNLPNPELDKANVLVVEDNLMNQKVIMLAIKDKVGSIDIANNGKEALVKFANTKYDIVLLDLQMPIMDGYKTFTKLKELEVGTEIHTPCIALTANAMAGDKEKCLSLGMDDYISKPFRVEQLVQKLEYHLAKSKVGKTNKQL